MKHGTIVRNMCQPSRESLLIYIGTSGRYAKCLWFIDGSFFGRHDFYKNDILHDREHFPIVGYVDYEKALLDAVRSGLFQKRRGSPDLEEAEAALRGGADG